MRLKMFSYRIIGIEIHKCHSCFYFQFLLPASTPSLSCFGVSCSVVVNSRYTAYFNGFKTRKSKVLEEGWIGTYDFFSNSMKLSAHHWSFLVVVDFRKVLKASVANLGKNLRISKKLSINPFYSFTIWKLLKIFSVICRYRHLPWRKYDLDKSQPK